MKRNLITTFAVVAISIGAMAQTDSTKTIKTDTVKTKETIKTNKTGAIIQLQNLLAYSPQTDSVKTKDKPNKEIKSIDTLKTGSLNSSSTMYYAFGPQTDSLDAKPNTPDTLKTGTKYSTGFVLNMKNLIAFNPIDGPQTDSTKTKSTPTIKSDSTGSSSNKKVGAIESKMLFVNKA